ncbi:MAG: ATP-binding protein [Planctomycetota bacterium]
MTEKQPHSDLETDLRRRAEEMVRNRAGLLQQHLSSYSPEEVQRAFHELHVHQIELEMQNVTLRQAQDDLEVERKRYFDLYNLAPVGYCTLNEQGQILEVNLTAVALLGTMKHDLINWSLDHFILQEDRDIFYLCRRQLFVTGEPQVCELWMVNIAGTTFWARLETNEVDGGKCGEPVYRVVITNITERKLVEEELRRYTDALQSTNKALEQSQQRAESATLAKSKFLANMSHELRTPMNAILGMVNLAMSKPMDPVARNFLEMTLESADLLLVLLNDLLDSAKIESGNLHFEAIPFSLRQLLAKTTHILAVRAGEKGISFSCHVTPDTPDVFVGDPMRLRQVVLNLADNAIKFTEQGDVEVRVAVELQDTDDVCLAFTFRDTGIGIAPGELETIFLPFEQAEASTVRRFGGTGLGLSISSSLVNRMGGRIRCESVKGRGSTFHFTIRLPQTTQPLLETVSAFEVSAAPLRPLRILLAEDNLMNQKLAAYILRERGHQVEIAEDGQQALDHVRRNDYDVLLMDLQMPNMDGYQATAAIRALSEPAKARLPIVAVTAHAMSEGTQHCREVGMDGYISKPIHAAEMIALIERLAEKTTGTPGQPKAGEPSSLATSATSVAPLKVFDLNEALKQCFDRKMFQDIVRYFVDESAEALEKMRVALGHRNAAALAVTAHHLLGTVNYLGAAPTQNATRRVEQAGKAGDLTAAAEAFTELEAQIELLTKALAPHHQGV